MRYGQPSIAAGLDALRAAGCDRITVLPLYPQYAASTVGSTYDAVFAVLRRWRNQPELRMVRHYFDHPAHIDALRDSVLAYWQQHGRPDCLLLSFHGLPQKSADLGDPYAQECLATGRALADALRLPENAYRISFQSRFGLQKWLQPYTDATLRDLAGKGYKRVDTLCPGFAADCLETLEEIAIEARATFLTAGGAEFHYIPALNASDGGVESLRQILMSHGTGSSSEGF
jgi:protoporphyrin/coproporphyrin ferrochelatase